MDAHGVLLMNKSSSQSRKASTALCAVLAAVLSTMLAGCNVGPKYVPPTMTAPQVFKESPTQFKETDGWKVAEPQDATLRGKWWEIYNEPDLNALEEQLNIDNQNIRESFENFMEARALVREARSQLFPTVSVGPAYTRSQQSSNLGSGAIATSESGKQSHSPPKFRGSPIFGERFATRSIPRSTTPRSPRPIWPMRS